MISPSPFKDSFNITQQQSLGGVDVLLGVMTSDLNCGLFSGCLHILSMVFLYGQFLHNYLLRSFHIVHTDQWVRSFGPVLITEYPMFCRREHGAKRTAMDAQTSLVQNRSKPKRTQGTVCYLGLLLAY